MDATALACRLDLDLDEVGICFACLFTVSMALDSGDEEVVGRALDFFTSLLWEEGLALPTLAALERARRAGDDEARAAIVEVERLGADAPVVRAIVRRLAQELGDRHRAAGAGCRGRLEVVPLEPR
jgi:hypothetical protein